MSVSCLVNGELTDQINVLDRGLTYGDGVFETIAMLDYRLPLWHQHMQRLISACKCLNIEPPDPQLLERETSRVIDKKKPSGTIRITITRGVGRRGYRPNTETGPTRIISFHDNNERSADYWTNGIALRLCRTRLGKSVVAGLKHLNRLEQVLAQSEWSSQDDFQEGVMLDYDGAVIEGTMSNIFAVIDDEIITPSLEHCGVEGVMRASVIELAKEHDLSLRIRKLSLEEIKTASEVFMTNSSVRIWPVRQFKEISWTAPGAMTSRLMSLLDTKLSTSGILVNVENTI